MTTKGIGEALFTFSYFRLYSGVCAIIKLEIFGAGIQQLGYQILNSLLKKFQEFKIIFILFLYLKLKQLSMKRSVKEKLRPVVAILAVCSFVMYSFVGVSESTMVDEEVTVTGEVLDMNCYMSGEKHGPAHKQCAQGCLSGGAPMGLLTKDKKVYLLTKNNANADAYKTLQGKAAEEVTVTGTLQEKGGVTAIVVSSVK